MTATLERIMQSSHQGVIDCQTAHGLAAELGLTPRALGQLIDEQTELRFDRCQLGLFGYGKKGTEAYKIVQAAKHCPPEIVAAIQLQVVDGRVPCTALWAIAQQFRYPRLGIGNIAEALGLKAKPCQLGCF
ncbi:MAG: hypothetical protein GXY68_06690 [Chloroflexi bacterium]|jgi:hypothetical protein|nr:hypothetical protein [Chloroflexota bacterium]